MNTDLHTLPTAFKENTNMRIAAWIVKYQNYKTKSAIQYAPEGYTENSLANYMVAGQAYIKSKKRNRVYNWMYPYLDKLIQQHIQPLTPSEAEKRRVYTFKKDYTTKENIPPVAKLEIMQKPLTAKFEYGIRFDDYIKLFDSEEEAKGFNKGIEFSKGTPGKLVTVELGAI